MTTRNQPRLAGDLLIGQKQRATTSRAAPKKHVSSVPDVVEEKRSVRGKDGQPTTCHVRYKKERFLGKVRSPLLDCPGRAASHLRPLARATRPCVLA